MFDMLNIFEVFLPQLLRYPNAADPLNGEASALMQQNPKAYNDKIKDYIKRYATKEHVDDGEEEDDGESDMSSVASYGSDEEGDDDGEVQAAGRMREL